MAYAALSTIQTIATGQVFTAATLQQANDNDEFLVDPPACSIKETTAQSLTNSTATALTSDEENFDNNAMHSTVSNTTRITCQTAGRYLCVASVAFAANATSNRQVEFYKNGAAVGGGALVASSGSTNSTGVVLVQMLVLAAADYVECVATQRSGGALNATLSEFALYYMTR